MFRGFFMDFLCLFAAKVGGSTEMVTFRMDQSGFRSGEPEILDRGLRKQQPLGSKKIWLQTAMRSATHSSWDLWWSVCDIYAIESRFWPYLKQLQKQLFQISNNVETSDIQVHLRYGLICLQIGLAQHLIHLIIPESRVKYHHSGAIHRYTPHLLLHGQRTLGSSWRNISPYCIPWRIRMYGILMVCRLPWIYPIKC